MGTNLPNIPVEASLPEQAQKNEAPHILEFSTESAEEPHYCTKSGRNTTQWHTSDFFVIRRERAGWEEWKSASALDNLFDTMPVRYQQNTTRYPPGES